MSVDENACTTCYINSEFQVLQYLFAVARIRFLRKKKLPNMTFSQLNAMCDPTSTNDVW